MKRPASYSDSWLILGSKEITTPILISSLNNQEILIEPIQSGRVTCFLFIFKGSFHLLLISMFETLFYFLYVNISENQGILQTINTYYNPIVSNCNTKWSNITKWLVRELLTHEINQQQVDSQGLHAYQSREAYNKKLFVISGVYSIICLCLCITTSVIVWYNKWKVSWKHMILENVGLILILGLYEMFFFKTIIYNYSTISTQELNKYIVDGLAQCVN